MNTDVQDFEQFMQQREAAARAYVRGDAAPLEQLVTRVSPATFFSPRGDYLEGADTVQARYQQDATAFEADSDTHFQILHMAASDGIAYWVGFQRARARMRGQTEPVLFNCV